MIQWCAHILNDQNEGQLWRSVNRNLCKYFYAFIALWLAFPCIAFAIWTMNFELLIGTRGTAFLIQSILNCIAAVCGMVLALLHYQKTKKALKNKIALALLAAGIAFLLLCWNFLCAFLDGMEEYHSFTSPDGTHTIVIMENISSISGQVVLYERVNSFLIEPKERIITDDGYRPVCAGKYALDWDGDTVALSVSDGAGGIETISATLLTRETLEINTGIAWKPWI